MGREITDDELDSDAFKPTCETCDHFREDPLNVSRVGHCTRYPPATMAIGDRIEPHYFKGQAYWHLGRFPMVLAFEVCGEWRNLDAVLRAQVRSISETFRCQIEAMKAREDLEDQLGVKRR